MSDGQEDRYLAQIDKLEEANKVVHRALLEIGAINIELKEITMNQAESIGEHIEEKIVLEQKVQKYDDLMNANAQVVKDNITLTETYQKLKNAEEEIVRLNKSIDVECGG